ncbi:ATP-binding protein [Silanimonas sp.]|jgi:predicted kinase|uniref:AAA family ATPase n=1 Tax=Silanimonas sp. TaxID=1929290 RepID=UPI0022C59E44|nr:ATP-binding protein [Silanimonas sp.]MCZ8063260.1 ATP-binding protein [Silanimonas sp.]
MLIALAGLPGAGKSTLAKGLQARLHAEIVSRDTIRMAEFPEWDDRAAKRAAFEIVRLDVSLLLRTGAKVVVDGATLATRAERHELHELAASLGALFVLLWLDLPPDVAAKRIATDHHDAPRDRQPGLAHAVAGRFDPPVDEDGVVHLDATVSAPALLEAALRAIRGDV